MRDSRANKITLPQKLGSVSHHSDATIFRVKRNRTTKTVTENFPATRIDTTFKDDEQVQPHISIFLLQELDRPWRHLRDSRNSVLLRNRRETHHWRERLKATLAQSDSIKIRTPHRSLEFGTCTDRERFPSMVKLASEPARQSGRATGSPVLGGPEKSHGPSGLPVPIHRHVYVSKNIGALCECDRTVPWWRESATV